MEKKKNNKGFKIYFIALYTVMAILFISVCLSLFFKDSAWTIAATAGFLVTAVLLVIVRYIFKRCIRENILCAALDLEKEHQQYMMQWEDPMLLLSSEARVVWCNEAFQKMTHFENVIGRHVDELGMDLEGGRADWDPVKKPVEVEGRRYMAYMRKVRIREENPLYLDGRNYSKIYILSFRDITRETQLEKENLDQQTVMALIYIDNYEQIFESMEESRKPLLEAMIYRYISNFSSDLEGILVRLEKNRFLLVFAHKYLEKMEATKFKILEDVKKLNYGNKYAATLSIGVGVDPNINTAREYARSAVDLALGRGGDQAVIKNKEKQIFYGGNSAATESNTRVRARLVAYALKEMIEEADRVIIMGHANPDLDCFGASLGLYRAATELKKPAHIVMSEAHPAVLDLYQRVKNEKDYVDIIISREQAEHYMKEENVLLILADVNRPSITQAPELLSRAAHIAVIDHHRSSEEPVEKVDVSYVEPYASSASEMVAEILQYLTENIPLKQVEADGLFAGIALDTKNFTVKTGVRTFEAAAYLRRKGADSVRVRQMFKNDMDEYKARAAIVSQAHILNGNMALAGWKANIENAPAIAAQAADELLDIQGIESSYVLTQIEDQIYVSARSLGRINVQLIMEELGGGGHMTVAGAQLKQMTLEEAEEKVVEAIKTVQERKA